MSNNVLFAIEQRIIHTLMIRSLYAKYIGLFDGKMGVSIALFHYARSANERSVARYAEALLENVLDSVTHGMGVFLGSGLSGIGWGVEYLLQNGFVDGDAAEVCEQIDQQIMRCDPRRIADHSLGTGLEGLMHYVLIHYKNDRVFDPQYIADIEHLIAQRTGSAYSIRKKALEYNADISRFVLPIDTTDGIIHNKPIGLCGGLSGNLLLSYPTPL